MILEFIIFSLAFMIVGSINLINPYIKFPSGTSIEITAQVDWVTADKTTTSTSFGDIDASDLVITLANRSGGKAILFFSARCHQGGTGGTLGDVRTRLEDGSTGHKAISMRNTDDNESYNPHFHITDLDGTTWTPQFRTDNVARTATVKEFHSFFRALEVSGLTISENSDRNPSSQTTTSTSYSAINSSDYKITLSSATGQALVCFNQDLRSSGSPDAAAVRLDVDSTPDTFEQASRDSLSEVMPVCLVWVGDLDGQVLTPEFRSISGGSATAYGSASGEAYEGYLVAAEVQGSSANVTTSRAVTSSDSTTTGFTYIDVTGMTVTMPTRTDMGFIGILSYQNGNSDSSDGQNQLRAQTIGGSGRVQVFDSSTARYSCNFVEASADGGSGATEHGEFRENSSGTATIYGTAPYESAIATLEISP